MAQRDIVELPAVTGHSGETSGMGFSIASGVAASADAGGWLILPGDMPSLKPATLLAVAAELPQHAVVYAQHIGRRGHPVGFASELYSELAALSGDEGRAAWWPVIRRSASRSTDPGVLIDVDHRSTTWRRCTRHSAPGAVQPAARPPLKARVLDGHSAAAGSPGRPNSECIASRT